MTTEIWQEKLKTETASLNNSLKTRHAALSEMALNLYCEFKAKSLLPLTSSLRRTKPEAIQKRHIKTVLKVTNSKGFLNSDGFTSLSAEAQQTIAAIQEQKFLSRKEHTRMNNLLRWENYLTNQKEILQEELKLKRPLTAAMQRFKLFALAATAAVLGVAVLATVGVNPTSANKQVENAPNIAKTAMPKIKIPEENVQKTASLTASTPEPPNEEIFPKVTKRANLSSRSDRTLDLIEEDVKEVIKNEFSLGPVIKRGIASYYTREKCIGCNPDRIMANGKPLDDKALTTATGSDIPLGTFVEITNEATGDKVIAEVTDRGGFSGPPWYRVLDMSDATRRAINCPKGLCDVTVRLVNKIVTGKE